MCIHLFLGIYLLNSLRSHRSSTVTSPLSARNAAAEQEVERLVREARLRNQTARQAVPVIARPPVEERKEDGSPERRPATTPPTLRFVVVR